MTVRLHLIAVFMLCTFHVSRRIFEIAPNAIELFPKFKDIPPNERENDEDYRHHALQVVEAVQLAVQTLDDLPGLTMVLHDLGSVHSLHGVYDPHFDVSRAWPVLSSSTNLPRYCFIRTSDNPPQFP